MFDCVDVLFIIEIFDEKVEMVDCILVDIMVVVLNVLLMLNILDSVIIVYEISKYIKCECGDNY